MKDDGGSVGSYVLLTNSKGEEAKLTLNKNFTISFERGSLSLRDYFAAHAPEIPDWYSGGFDEPEPPKVNWDAPNHQEAADAVAGWVDRRDTWRTPRWPYAWADMMLEERSK